MTVVFSNERIFTKAQLALSTAQEQENYFTRVPELRAELPHSTLVSGINLPPGVYRVVNGQLHRILDLHAPFVATAPKG